MFSKYKLYFFIALGALAIAAGVYFYKKRKKTQTNKATANIAGTSTSSVMGDNEAHAIQKSMAYISQN